MSNKEIPSSRKEIQINQNAKNEKKNQSSIISFFFVSHFYKHFFLRIALLHANNNSLKQFKDKWRKFFLCNLISSFAAATNLLPHQRNKKREFLEN